MVCCSPSLLLRQWTILPIPDPLNKSHEDTEIHSFNVQTTSSLPTLMAIYSGDKSNDFSHKKFLFSPLAYILETTFN